MLTALYSCSCSSKKPKEKTYTIARDPSWEKISLLGREDHLKGFVDDVLRIISKEEGVTINLVATSRSQIHNALKNGELDAIVSNKRVLKSREDYYNFSDPFFFVGPVLIVTSDSTVKGFEDLYDKTIGLLTGSDAILYVEKHPSIRIKTYYNILVGINSLINKDIDAVVMGLVPAHAYTENIYRGKLKVVSDSLTDNSLRLLTLKTDGKNELIDLFNRNINKIQEDGRYDMLLRKWGLYQ